MTRSLATTLVALCAAAAPAVASAQAYGSAMPGADRSDQARVAAEVLRIGVDEHLNDPMPMDTELIDHEGHETTLGAVASGQPTLLVFAYHSCPIMCSLVLDGMNEALSGLVWDAGRQFNVVVVSIDADDTTAAAAEKLAEAIARYGRAGTEGGFHYLTADFSDIEDLTEAAGIRYFKQPASGRYAHPAVLLFLTPEGRIARYLYGLEFDPTQVRLSLIEASQGRSLSTTDRVLQSCYRFDPAGNEYVNMAFRMMQGGGVLTVLLLGFFLVRFWRRERRPNPEGAETFSLSAPEHAGNPS